MIAMKIMIVEDEENIRDGIRNLVDWNQEGFEEPLLFSSAVEALVFLETETVDVVLTDLYMPVLNGIYPYATRAEPSVRGNYSDRTRTF